MIRFGAVNIDTSHPLGFAEVLETSSRAKYTAVYNDGFRGEDEVEGFIKRFGLEKRCETLDELADSCDIGLIHGCNWDDHLRCAEPFWKKGKPVFLDKPVVGSVAGIRRLEEFVRGGAVVLGASSARYAYELQQFMQTPEDERGRVVHVLGTAGVDEFNYGVHVVEAIGGILGQGAQWVQYMGRGEVPRTAQPVPEGATPYSESYYVQFEDGQSAVYTTFTGVWQPFVLTAITTKTTWTAKLDSARLYAALIDQLCDYMENKPNLLAGPAALMESVKIMLAGKASRENGGGRVFLAELPEDTAFDGAAFTKSYAATAGKIYV